MRKALLINSYGVYNDSKISAFISKVRFIMVENEKNTSESYYATEMLIEEEKFIMYLSEAAENGKILTNENFKFRFS